MALAQIPSQDGVISTCYSRSGGALRVIDEGTPCKSNENRLTWNQQGRPGAQGETGAQGPAGPMGPAGANGADGADGADGPTGATGAEGPVGPAGAAGPAGPAAERLFASVSTDGTLVSGTAIASSKTEVGAYTVTFGREVRGCAGVANIGFAHGGSGSVDATGLVTQVDVGVGNPNVVHVRHYDNDPTFFDGVDESFHLVVVC